MSRIVSSAAQQTIVGPDNSTHEAAALRTEIETLVRRYADVAHKPKGFVPGETRVPVSGKVYDGDELARLVDASLDFWLTTGRFNSQFQNQLAKYIGTGHVMTVNSGSSANLVAVTALTSPLLKDDALRPGDEVITCATGFPTTVNPVIQNGLRPVFLDVQLGTYNMDMTLLEEAVSRRTRAVVPAHALGNPFDLRAVTAFCEKYDLLLVEDCCDALGATYGGRSVGTFGAFGTVSFYPAHHITMGEGGAVWTRNPIYRRAAESVRDWGRDCWCEPGFDNTCGQRFDWQLGTLPAGYDHKYMYSHMGYNLKITDMQAAVGVAQLSKIEYFIAARRRNFDRLKLGLKSLEDVLILPEPTPNSEPSWFGFPITLRDGGSKLRNKITECLNGDKIDTRLLFGGNLTHQPYMLGREYRVVGSLDNSDIVMNNTFWVGVYPGLQDDQIDYMVESLHRAVGKSVA